MSIDLQLFRAGAIAGWLAACAVVSGAPAPAQMTVAGPWEVRVVVPGVPPVDATLRIEPPRIEVVESERFDCLPNFNPANCSPMP